MATNIKGDKTAERIASGSFAKNEISANVANAVVGLDELVDDTFATDASVTAGDAAVVSALQTYVIAGADNTTTHDYTASGVVAGSTVFAALAFKDQATVVAAVAGTITPGTDKITVATGADLSTGFTLVFIVKK